MTNPSPDHPKTAPANTEQAFANFDLRAEAPEARKPTVRFAFENQALLDLFEPADEAAAKARRTSRITGVFAVLIVMGTPSTVATLSGEVFYYISQRSERKVAFMNQQVIDQRVIAVYFDKNRTVMRIANYGLQDGKIFDFISRTTPTSGQEMSYLTPLFKLMSFH